VLSPRVKGFGRSQRERRRYKWQLRRTGEARFPRQIDNSLAFDLLSMEFTLGSLPAQTPSSALRLSIQDKN
jgi:hypothetical protein